MPIKNIKINKIEKFYNEKKFLALNSNKLKKTFKFKNKIPINELYSVFEIYEKFYNKKIKLNDLNNHFYKYIEN